MKSNATTVSAYLDSLPAPRRKVLESLRILFSEFLEPVLNEQMLYGVIAYCVPLTGRGAWPHGHHTNPALPLMYLGLSSQKNDMVVYMLFLVHSTPRRKHFIKAWEASGKKSRLQVGGMGCCLRFNKLDDLALSVITDAITRTPVHAYLTDHTAMLARLGKAPDGAPLRRSLKPGPRTAAIKKSSNRRA